MPADNKAVYRAHCRKAGANNTNGVLNNGPYCGIHGRPSRIFVRQSFDDYGAVDTGYADEATQEEDANQLNFPVQLHMQLAYQRDREQDGHYIRNHVDRAWDDCRRQYIDACAFSFRVPSFVDGVALEDGEEYFGDIVHKDDGCETPQESCEARN